ncbi:MAG: asparagine synthase (glutamine-hydrolyzing) [Chitinophagaceae bacterium]|nr:asparagine synthase (glutamine-hydrolyzing) [Chitinophagaceae bacterium]
MCGIAGSVSFPLPAEVCKNILRHRGPDEQMDWNKGKVQFIHTRLAIQELGPAGRQPMHLDGLHMVYNGEIYNHLELRDTFNLKCSSHSDTETLLHLFQKMGIGMLHHLDGMFAWAVYDENQNKLFLARDRAGEKPLYYIHDSEFFVFASELRLLRSIFQPEINHQHVANLLAFGFLPTDATPYTKIKELPPGTYMEVDLGTMKVDLKKWWSLRFSDQAFEIRTESEAVEMADDLLKRSIRRRIASSDLEVGVFLSGGIDSGLVTSMASAFHPGLKTYTVSFDGLYDESAKAALTAARTETRHYVISVPVADLQDDLEKIFLHYGEPIVDDSIIPSYYIAREVKRHVTVVLNGDGGDELFGGYRRHFLFRNYNFFSNRLQPLGKVLRKIYKSPQAKINLNNYLYRLFILLSSSRQNAYFAATTNLLHEFPDDFLVKPDYEKCIFLDAADGARTSLQKIMALDFNNILPSILLVKVDISSMANSLESRTVFFSPELLDFTSRLSDGLKIKNLQTKYLLRKLAKKYLPADIVHNPKRGFEVPLIDWVDNKIHTLIFDYLSPSNAYVRSILNPRLIDKILLNKLSISADQRSKVLFALLSVECWHQNRIKL